MKIGYITESFSGSKGNGITSQAQTWASMLNSLLPGTVTLVNPWEPIDWNEGDIVHLFGSSNTWFWDTTKKLKKRGCRVYWSPICDNTDSPRIQKIKSFLGNESFQIFSLPFIRKKTCNLVDKIFVRSEYEQKYLEKAYNISPEKMVFVPLSLSTEESYEYGPKEPFCLHISSIYQSRKNVLRLISAAKKYGFHLKLIGDKGSPEQYKPIQEAIEGCQNIEVLGFVSEQEKKQLYKSAKVFALPSLKEGVGIVALDAAHYGCEVIITSIGGPKEYFGKFGHVVNPYDIDDIGKNILKAMNQGFQPFLKEYVDKNFSKAHITEKLLKIYGVK